MMQATMPICGLVDELNKKLSNASECYAREEMTMCRDMIQDSQEKPSNNGLQFSTRPWLQQLFTT